jgi:hypothetical protein
MLEEFQDIMFEPTRGSCHVTFVALLIDPWSEELKPYLSLRSLISHTDILISWILVAMHDVVLFFSINGQFVVEKQ